MGKSGEAVTGIEAIQGGSRGQVVAVEPQAAGDGRIQKATRRVHVQKAARSEHAQKDTSKGQNSAGREPRALTPAGHEALRGWYEAKGLQLIIQRDGENGKMMAVLVNPATGKVVRQVPLEDLLGLEQSIEQYQGVLVDRTQ